MLRITNAFTKIMLTFETTFKMKDLPIELPFRQCLFRGLESVTQLTLETTPCEGDSPPLVTTPNNKRRKCNPGANHTFSVPSHLGALFCFCSSFHSSETSDANKPGVSPTREEDMERTVSSVIGVSSVKK